MIAPSRAGWLLPFVLAALASAGSAQEPAAPIDFVATIRPLLAKRCYECHGPKEQEADLRFDRKATVFHADETAWVIRPGKSADSVLYQRITLPPDDPDVMPNEGEPLTAEEIALFKRWIDEGAHWPDEAAEHEPEAEAAPAATIEVAEVSAEEAAGEDRALEALRARGALAMRIAENTPALDAAFHLLGAQVTDQDLALLAGLEKRLVWLNLARTGVTDAGLEKLASFRALQRLDLSRTAITDAGLAHVAGLSNLRYLNLYGTKVTDAGLAHIAGLANLEKLFVWQTEVTQAGAARLRAAVPAVQIDRGEYVEIIQRTAEEVAAAKAEAEKKKAESKPINETCPVSGKAASADFVVVWEGKRIGFCCEKCVAKFEADPAEIAKKVPELQKK